MCKRIATSGSWIRFAAMRDGRDRNGARFAHTKGNGTEARVSHMRSCLPSPAALLIIGLIGSPQLAVAGGLIHSATHASTSAVRQDAGSRVGARAVLWREPVNVANRNLFFGPGGREHQPHGPFTFVQED